MPTSTDRIPAGPANLSAKGNVCFLCMSDLDLGASVARKKGLDKEIKIKFAKCLPTGNELIAYLASLGGATRKRKRGEGDIRPHVVDAFVQHDLRDKARLVAFGVDNPDAIIHTVSLQSSGVYSSRHVRANMATPQFISQMKDKFGEDIMFSCVYCDYYWMQQGWISGVLTEFWFKVNLPRLWEMLEDDGRIIMPFDIWTFFCTVKYSQLLAKIGYEISFINKEENGLYLATEKIPASYMCHSFGKLPGQEEFHCGATQEELNERFRPYGRETLTEVTDLWKAAGRGAMSIVCQKVERDRGGFATGPHRIIKNLVGDVRELKKAALRPPPKTHTERMGRNGPDSELGKACPFEKMILRLDHFAVNVDLDDATRQKVRRVAAEFPPVKHEDIDNMVNTGRASSSLVQYAMQFFRLSDSADDECVSFLPVMKADGQEMSWEGQGIMGLFRKKILFLPIKVGHGWSLCVVVNPGQIGRMYSNNFLGEDHPCILFMGKLMGNVKVSICNRLVAWLDGEWVQQGIIGFRGQADVRGCPRPFHKMPAMTTTFMHAGDQHSWLYVCLYIHNLYILRDTVFTFSDIVRSCNDLISSGPEITNIDVSITRKKLGNLIAQVEQKQLIVADEIAHNISEGIAKICGF